MAGTINHDEVMDVTENNDPNEVPGIVYDKDAGGIYYYEVDTKL